MPTLHLHYETLPGETIEIVNGEPQALFWSGDGWWAGSVDLEGPYRYRLIRPDGSVLHEAGGLRPVPDGDAVVDRWRSHDPAARSRQSALFTRAIAGRFPPEPTPDGSLRFRLLEPALPEGHTVAIVGNDPALGGWDTERAVRLAATDFPWWTAAVDLEGRNVDLVYKYVVRSPDGELWWEDGEDRHLLDSPIDEVVDNGLRGLPGWRGAGVAVPVFSLRTQRSIGVGQFLDLIPFVDWAADVGCSVVQLLPVNDTVKNHDWGDSYPYDPISVHALHPLYLDIAEVASRHEISKVALAAPIAEARGRLDGSVEVAYEHVMADKWELALRAFDMVIADEAEELATFAGTEWEWLGAYAAWCVLRDRHGTPDHTQWGVDATFDPDRVDALADPSSTAHRELVFHCWLQMHLHRQLDTAVAHARARGVAVKGDLPIGVSPTSVEVWKRPDLFRAGTQTGAPPDAFAVRGQNWWFPTYVWEAMADEDFAWWKSRFEAMGRSVDMYRIDHILGFWRIWEIPAGAIDGLLGSFRPCFPLDGDAIAAELAVPIGHLRDPVIDDQVLRDRFGVLTDDVRAACFEGPATGLRFKDAFADQVSIRDGFDDLGLPDEALRDLLDLRAEVLLLPVEGGDHPRISWGDTEAYRRLDDEQRVRFNEIAADFYFHRHEEMWAEHARGILSPLLDATSLLACGEDLGMVPASVPPTMADLGVLSLEIERMPKALGTWRADPAGAPYASVVSPSTHDMAPLRQWWEEEPDVAARFWHEVLGEEGEVPGTLDGSTAERLVVAQLDSPAMLAIIPIQDLLAIDETIRRTDPAERINFPADRLHKWRYRLHVTVEDLQAAEGFNGSVRSLIETSGRA